MELKQIRKHLDRLDDSILILLAERLSYSELVLKYKKQNNIKIHQPEREEQIIKEKRKKAEEYQLNPEFAEEIFLKIINESSRIQRELE